MYSDHRCSNNHLSYLHLPLLLSHITRWFVLLLFETHNFLLWTAHSNSVGRSHNKTVITPTTFNDILNSSHFLLWIRQSGELCLDIQRVVMYSTPHGAWASFIQLSCSRSKLNIFNFKNRICNGIPQEMPEATQRVQMHTHKSTNTHSITEYVLNSADISVFKQISLTYGTRKHPSVMPMYMGPGVHLHNFRNYLLNRTGTSIKRPTPINEVLIVRPEQCPAT